MSAILGFVGTFITIFVFLRLFRWWFFLGYPEIRRDFEEFERTQNCEGVANGK